MTRQSPSSRSWLDRLLNVDPRVIYVVIGLAAVVPLLAPDFVLPVTVTEPVRNVYEAVEKLPPGSRVFVAMDFDPSLDPEMTPMTVAFLRHCFRRKLKVTGMTLWPQGVTLGLQNLQRAARHRYREVVRGPGGEPARAADGSYAYRETEVRAREREDWVYLGAQPGG